MATEEDVQADTNEGNGKDSISRVHSTDQIRQHSSSELIGYGSAGETIVRESIVQQRRTSTSGKAPSLRLERPRSSLFMTSSEQSESSSSEEADEPTMQPMGDAVSERGLVIQNSADNPGDSCVSTGATDDADRGNESPQGASILYDGSGAESPGLLCRSSTPPDELLRTPNHHITARSPETGGNGECETHLEEVPEQSSFFDEGYEATIASWSPLMFSPICPDCSGSCTVGRAPDNWG